MENTWEEIEVITVIQTQDQSKVEDEINQRMSKIIAFEWNASFQQPHKTL